MAADNKSLGRFLLDGIPPAPRGIPQIEVTFDIDANGIMKVSAKDMGSGKEQHITIEGSAKLDDAEVERMRKDAEAHAAEDERRKSAVDTRNAADQAVFQAESLLKQSGDKLGEHKDSVESAVDALKGLLQDPDASSDELAGKTEALHKALEPAVVAMYQAAAAETEEGPGDDGDTGPEWSGKPDGDDAKEEVVDAEFEEKQAEDEED